jgi:hypothetical protein
MVGEVTERTCGADILSIVNGIQEAEKHSNSVDGR